MSSKKNVSASKSPQRSEFKSRLLAGGVGLVLVLLLAACGSSDPTPTNTAPPTATPIPQATEVPEPTATSTPPKEAWEIEWEETVAKAKEEGSLVMAVAAPRWNPFLPIFEDKFGIKVEVLAGSSREQANRILAERRAGRYEVDHMSPGSSVIRDILIPNDMLKPILPELILPEVKDPSNWYQGRLWWSAADPEGKYHMQFATAADPIADLQSFVNTNNVTPAEYDSINSVWDYLDPRFKGKIVAFHPETGTSGPYRVGAFHPQIGLEWFERFFKEMEPVFIGDTRLIVDQLGLGAFDLAVLLASGSFGDVTEFKNQGGPVRGFWEKGSAWKEGGYFNYGSSNRAISIFDPNPHPNAARVMVNWLMSQEGQTQMHLHFAEGTRRYPRPTLRVDVDEWGLTHPEERRVPGVEYYWIEGLPEFDLDASSARIVELYQAYVGGQ